MTYAPAALTSLGRYWVSKGGVNLGVVGDTAHQAKGRSYHLGKSQLTADAYSRITARDRAGLTEAASAIDLGRLRTADEIRRGVPARNYGRLRAFSRWLVVQCQASAPGTQDIREVIYTPNGKVVWRWDRERGVLSVPHAGEADRSHITHTHVSFYRDSEKRSKVGIFMPFFTTAAPTPAPKRGATTLELLDAMVAYAGRLTGTPHDKAAFARNATLLRSRLAAQDD